RRAARRAAGLRRRPRVEAAARGPWARWTRKRPRATGYKGAISSPASRRSMLLLGQDSDHDALLVIEVLLRDLLHLLGRHRERRLEVFRERAGVLRKHLVVVELIALAAESTHAFQLGKEAVLEVPFRPRQLVRRGGLIAQPLHLVGEDGHDLLGGVPGLYRGSDLDHSAELHRGIPG